MKKYDWHPVKENVFPKIDELVQVTYRVACHGENFWNLMSAHYVGDGIFVLYPDGKKVRRAVSAFIFLMIGIIVKTSKTGGNFNPAIIIRC